MTNCDSCQTKRAQTKRAETGEKLCKDCFCTKFEDEVYQTIKRFNLIEKDDVIGIGVSGGKDSSCLMHVLHALNQRYNMGFKIKLICIDEGIYGYRDKALDAVQANAKKYDLPLLILSFEELFEGWSLDDVFKATQTKETCSYCGVFRRRSLDIGASKAGVTKVAVGHNANDVAETVLLNMIRGDMGRFERSVDILTAGIFNSDPMLNVSPRIKPFAFSSQKDIVLYVHFKGLVYYAVECPYAVQAFRRFSREYLVEKEKVDPGIMRRIIEGAIAFQNDPGKEKLDLNLKRCLKCNAPSSQDMCTVCNLLNRLRKGHARIQVKD